VIATLTFLDAEACIAMLKGKSGIKDLLETIKTPLATTTLALFEVQCGIEYYRKKGIIDREVKSLTKLEKLRIFYLDSISARKAGAIWAELKLKGKMIKIIDILIASIILTKGFNQIISNDEHFSQIDGIEKIPYTI